MKEVVIVSAARTAIGSFGGSLAGVSAVDLGITAAKGAIERAGIDASLIDEAVIGNVLGAGLGQNIARQVILGAGLPNTTPAFSINKVCGSGLRTVELAAQIIKAGDADIILAGGTESMSNAPYLVKGARFGVKMGNQTLIDEMITDGLWDAYNNYHMGVTAENIAEQFNITREEQDSFALASQQKASSAIENNKFVNEITPITIKTRREEIIFDTDEYVRPETTLESLSKLRPAFKKDGTVTAGNASGINDGAACVILMSEDKANELGLDILAYVDGYTTVGLDNKVMGLGPIHATQKVLSKLNLDIKDIDLFEMNEAFASQSIAVTRELGLDSSKVNINGGAIALGHPIGASGCRVLVTLVHSLINENKNRGICSLCIGGGQGVAMAISKK